MRKAIAEADGKRLNHLATLKANKQAKRKQAEQQSASESDDIAEIISSDDDIESTRGVEIEPITTAKTGQSTDASKQ